MEEKQHHFSAIYNIKKMQLKHERKQILKECTLKEWTGQKCFARSDAWDHWSINQESNVLFKIFSEEIQVILESDSKFYNAGDSVYVGNINITLWMRFKPEWLCYTLWWVASVNNTKKHEVFRGLFCFFVFFVFIKETVSVLKKYFVLQIL